MGKHCVIKGKQMPTTVAEAILKYHLVDLRVLLIHDLFSVKNH